MPISSAKLYTIKEYESLTCEKKLAGYRALPLNTFNALEDFVLTASSNYGTEALELLSLSARRGIGKIITAKNYVGIIAMNDGTVIEILPKIVGSNLSDDDRKLIFLRMLKTLRDINFKKFNISSVQIEHMGILEIFIKMFVDEVAALTKQGLRSSYVQKEANENFYKGKLVASKNIKYNLANKARFYVRYDDFSLDRPENRLIKSTLAYLYKLTSDGSNRQSLRRLLSFFESVGFSQRYEADFQKCANDRSVSHYAQALAWCKVFLQGNSFTSFAGSEVALALLFPMEKVFESYIAAEFRKHLDSGIKIKVQDQRYSLFDSPRRTFLLKPDIVITDGNETVVLDTKWKLLSPTSPNHGISQSDMYQMYAYSKKYDAKKIMLLYPLSDKLSSDSIKPYSAKDNVRVEVVFVDLSNPDTEIQEILRNAFN